MNINLLELIILLIVALLVGMLINYPGEVKAYARSDNFICSPVNITQLENDTLLHEQCHLLVNNNWEHFCTMEDEIE